MKIEALRAFVTVAKHGNLRDAADELRRTQSALSMVLSQMEDTLGGALFETDRKRDLTVLGRFVRDSSVDLLREHDRVMGLIAGFAKGDAGHLRIASVPSVAALILPDILSEFMEAYPGARIDLMDSDSTAVRGMVADGQADIGIAGRAPAGHTLTALPLFQDVMHVVCRKTSNLAQTHEHLTWRDLEGAPLIVNEALSVFRAPVARDVISASKLSVRNILSLFAMVNSGRGITVLPGLATRSLDPGLVAIPLIGADSNRQISMLLHDDLVGSPISQAFQSHLLKTMPRLLDQFGLEAP